MLHWFPKPQVEHELKQERLNTLEGPFYVKMSERKSAVEARISSLLVELEQELADSEWKSVNKYQSAKRILDKRLSKIEDQASNQKISPADRLSYETDRVAIIQAQKDLEPIVATRFLAESVTPEKLANLMAEQQGCLGILSAEGGLFGDMAGRYSDITSIDIWLKGHSGESYRVDRVGRSPDHIKRATLTVGLAVQPEVIIQAFSNREFTGRGLLARFLYSVPPARTMPRELHPPSVSEELEQDYKGLIQHLTRRNRQTKPLMTLSAGASEVFDELRGSLELQCLPGGDLSEGPLCEWANKLAGAIARIAGLLHMAAHENSFAKLEVSGKTMQDATMIGLYYLEHAKALFEKSNHDVDGAHIVVNWILRNGQKMFTARDVMQINRRRFATVKDVEPILDYLTERGYIRGLPSEGRSGTGRPGSPKWEPNPALFVI